MGAGEQAAFARRDRIHGLDLLRGLMVLLMVLHHAAFSYYYVFDGAVNLYRPFIGLVQIVAVSVFFSVSGVSSGLSHSNVQRGIKTLAFALLISIVTYLLGPQYFISFGVIHCLGSCMLFHGLLKGTTDRLFGKATPLVWLSFYVIFYFLSYKQVSFPGLFWLGYYNTSYYSADYYPLLPWLFMYLFGGSVSRYVIEGRFPAWFYRVRCKVLEWIGTHALYVYVLHQPIIWGLLFVVLWLIRGQMPL